MGSEITIAGWLAALLKDSAAKLANDQHLLDKAVEQNLKKLQFNLDKITTAAQLDRKQIGSHSITDWFSSFKDAIYSADDVIEEFVQQLEKDKKQSTSSTLRRSANFVSKIIQGSQFNGDYMKQLDEVTKTFDGLVGDIFGLLKVVQQLEGSGGTKQQEIIPSWRLTTSTYKGRTTTRGRASEGRKILEVLLEEGGGSISDFCKFSVVCVVGTGGIGKTDLARFAYNNEKVRRHFDLKAWVTVCNNFDEKRLMIEIIESASVERPSDLHNITNLEPIQNTLAKGMTDKRFLIVLDDVWEDSNTSWELLTTPFTHGKEGSRIIVTTQLESVAKSTKAKETIHLDGLEEQEYLELFKKCAFGDKDKDQQPLERICSEIAQKYDGSPLAAVSIGLELKSDLREEHWRRVARNKLGVVERREGDIVSVLGFSYDQLPARLKQCYLACALFPKRHCFCKDQLLRIWRALRFVSANDNGGNPVDELASKSFFMNSKREDGQFVLHAVLHELADLLCDGEFFRVEDEDISDREIKIPKKARHVYVSNANNFVRVSEALAEKEQLRSLVIDGRMPSHDAIPKFMNSLETVSKKCKFLRLLMLPKEFPLASSVANHAIGRLSHLRCLDFDGIQDKPLPQYLGSLNLLQWPNLKQQSEAGNLLIKVSSRKQEAATGSEKGATSSALNPRRSTSNSSANLPS